MFASKKDEEYGPCVWLIAYSLALSSIIGGSIILAQTNGASDGCFNVWKYCLAVVVVSAISSVWLLIGQCLDVECMKTVAKGFRYVTTFTFFVLGVVIYTSLKKEATCYSFYDDQYHDLFVLLQVYMCFYIIGAIICAAGLCWKGCEFVVFMCDMPRPSSKAKATAGAGAGVADPATRV